MPKIEMDKQYRTRDGQEVRIYATDGGDLHSVHEAIKNDEGWIMRRWDSFGICANNYGFIGDDLFEVKPRIKRNVWVNVHTHDVTCHNSRYTADYLAKDDRLACIKVTIDCEEGEGL